MPNLILAIDQGTTGTTALIFDESMKIHGSVTTDFPQYFPKAQWVEHSLDEIWKSVETSVKGVIEKTGTHAKQISAIGITNQRETTCLWNKKTGSPLHPAIVWQDRRTADECSRLKKQGLEKKIQKKTGLLLDPYFSATKLAWLLKHLPKSQDMAFGTIDSFLLFRMTGEHRTDPSNASRTLLMNIESLEWDGDLLKLFKIPESLLPEIFPSCVEYGKTRGLSFLPDGIPITGMVGDQQAALFGQACFEPRQAKCTYGTGAFILANTGKNLVFSKNRLLTTVAWKIGKHATYALEGSSFIAGAAVQWLRDGLKIISNSAEVESLAKEVTDSDGVMFVPALSGLGAPHWMPRATGMFTGLNRGTTRGHIARATLEGIAFQVEELLMAMTADFKKKLKSVNVDGGASANHLLMQFQADLLGVDVVRSKVLETTALGAALQAGIGVGIFSGFGDIKKHWQIDKVFRSQITSAQRKKLTHRWSQAIKAVALLGHTTERS